MKPLRKKKKKTFMKQTRPKKKHEINLLKQTFFYLLSMNQIPHEHFYLLSYCLLQYSLLTQQACQKQPRDANIWQN